jgi:hypothetical protein
MDSAPGSTVVDPASTGDTGRACRYQAGTVRHRMVTDIILKSTYKRHHTRRSASLAYSGLIPYDGGSNAVARYAEPYTWNRRESGMKDVDGYPIGGQSTLYAFRFGERPMSYHGEIRYSLG